MPFGLSEIISLSKADWEVPSAQHAVFWDNNTREQELPIPAGALPYSCQLGLMLPQLCIFGDCPAPPVGEPLCPLPSEPRDRWPPPPATELWENSSVPRFSVTVIQRRSLFLQGARGHHQSCASDNRNNQAWIINLWLTNYWSISLKPRSKNVLFHLWREHFQEYPLLEIAYICVAYLWSSDQVALGSMGYCIWFPEYQHSLALGSVVYFRASHLLILQAYTSSNFMCFWLFFLLVYFFLTKI